MRRVLKEPLLHFVLLGALLFGLYGLERPTIASAERIEVNAGQIEHLASVFSRVWQRPPTFAELKGLVDDYVKEEMLGREAIALGMDRNDSVIRRRLRQKMEVVVEDLVAAVEPGEAELQEYLRRHPDQFREQPRISFRQVFLREERGDRLEADAAELLARLRSSGAGADVSALGDSQMLPTEFTLEQRSRVAAQFGPEFAESLDGIEAGAWAGPLRSAYGWHIVRVTERVEGRRPALEEVRGSVRRELLAERRERAHQDLVEGLLDKYEVTIDWPQGDGVPTAIVATTRG